MAENELFSWKKFLSGLFNPLNFAKSFVFTVQACVIALTVACIVFTGYWVYKRTKPKAPVPPVSIGTNSGQVHSSVDDNRKKFGLVNF